MTRETSSLSFDGQNMEVGRNIYSSSPGRTCSHLGPDRGHRTEGRQGDVSGMGRRVAGVISNPTKCVESDSSRSPPL